MILGSHIIGPLFSLSATFQTLEQEISYATQNSRHATRKTDMSLMLYVTTKKQNTMKYTLSMSSFMFIFDFIFRFVKFYLFTTSPNI